MGLGLLSMYQPIYFNLKWKQNDFLKHILIIYEMVKCKLPGDMVTQTARIARTSFFGAPKTHFDPGKTLTPTHTCTHAHTHTLSPTHSLPRARTHARTHARAHAHTYTRAHARAHARASARATYGPRRTQQRAHTHAHTHAHTQQLRHSNC